MFEMKPKETCKLRTLDEECVYYVYAHYRPKDDIPFYIGKGKERRAWICESRNKWWNNIVNKNNGFDVKFLYENINEWDAWCLEVLFIWAYGRKDQNRGPLVNMTDGGEGLTALSPELREERRKVMMGNTYGRGNKGSVHSVELREKNSLGHLGLPSPMKGRKFSKVQLERKRKAHAGMRTYSNDELKISKRFKAENVPEGWYLSTKYAKKRRPITEITRERMRVSHLNQKHSKKQDEMNSKRLKALGKDNPIFRNRKPKRV